MQLDLGYTDPLLVSTYDIENGGRDDIEFYLAVSAELGASKVIDLGCGTGVLATELAATGIDVVGVDPADAMLDVARRRPGGGDVEWVLGDAGSMKSESADLIVMTGHAAQVLLTDAEWEAMLTNAFRALTPGGHLIFEIRNPQFKAWEHWNEAESAGDFDLPDGSSFRSWVQVTQVTGDLVTFEAHSVFNSTFEDVVSFSTLRFRSQAEAETSLRAVGFRLKTVYGDWDRRAVTPNDRELIFVAQRPTS